MDLTLVVPVRDRQKNLCKIFSYYKDLECRKIVVDSSLEEFSSEMVPDDFEYIYLGPTPWMEMSHIIFNMVDTKYVLDNPDDDLTLLSAIPKCIQHMEENERCVSCSGITYSLSDNNKRGDSYFIISPLRPKTTYSNIELTKDNKFSNQNIKEILKKTFVEGLHLPLNHSIVKTEVHQEIISFFYNNKGIADIKLVDRVFTFLIKLFGESHTLPINYQLRDKRDNSIIDLPNIQEEYHYNTPREDMVTDSNVYPLAAYLTSITGDDEQDSLDFCKHLLLTNMAQENDYCVEYDSISQSPTVPCLRKFTMMGAQQGRLDYFRFLSEAGLKELLNTILIITNGSIYRS